MYVFIEIIRIQTDKFLSAIKNFIAFVVCSVKNELLPSEWSKEKYFEKFFKKII